jgi:hypothetical protein
MATATGSRASKPVERPQRADDPRAPAGVHATGDRGLTLRTNAPSARVTAIERRQREHELDEEIRKRLRFRDERGPADVFSDEFGTALGNLIAATIGYYPPDSDDMRDDENSLWTDLRPSQRARLLDLIDDLYELEGEVFARLTSAIIQAGVTFAADYPDALRARPQPIEVNP